MVKWSIQKFVGTGLQVYGLGKPVSVRLSILLDHLVNYLTMNNLIKPNYTFSFCFLLLCFFLHSYQKFCTRLTVIRWWRPDFRKYFIIKIIIQSISWTLANSNLTLTATEIDFPWIFLIHLLHFYLRKLIPSISWTFL